MLETPARIEPCLFEDDAPRILADLVAEIQQAASLLGADLHPDAASELAEFVRVMNCCYSNLIEGHITRPRDIERALAGAEVDPDRRPLALEAQAHVIVQRQIDEAHRSGTSPMPTSTAFIRNTHRRLYENMPDTFRSAKGRDGRDTLIAPGTFRQVSRRM